VHDRRIDGETFVFGNAGGLFFNAMTWWDHTTSSLWSQPTGRAIAGELKGTELELLPSQMTTWSNWLQAHPETLAMTNGYAQTSLARQTFDTDFIIGVVISDLSKAYTYEDVAAEILVNDQLGEFPLLVWAAHNDYRSFLRQVGDQTLSFEPLEGNSDLFTDRETGSTWEANIGLATAGPLKGEALQPAPSLTSFDWAWEDFYPDSEYYHP
jgi:hypothetical protein